MKNTKRFQEKWQTVKKRIKKKIDLLSLNNIWIKEGGRDEISDNLWTVPDRTKRKVHKLVQEVYPTTPNSMQLQPIQNRKMKKSIFILAASTLMTASIFIGCDGPATSTESSQMMMNDTIKSNEAHMADMKSYRKESAMKLAAYDQEIKAYKAKMENKKQENKADYEKKVAALEQQNRDLKKKMNSYKEEGKEKWDTFKTEMNKDMDELGKALNDSSLVKLQ